MPSMTDSTFDLHAAGCLAVIVVCIAAWTDVRARKIYNSLTYPAMIVGLMLALISSGSGRLDFLSGISVGESLAGLLGCGALMLVPYHLSRGGAGDVKLAMAMGSLIGFQTTLQGFCAGYILAASYLIIRMGVTSAAQRIASGNYRLAVGSVTASVASQGANIEQPIPLAGFFMIGMAAVVCFGPLW